MNWVSVNKEKTPSETNKELKVEELHILICIQGML